MAATRKTSVEINEELLRLVQGILATTTVRETVEEAFREVVRARARREGLSPEERRERVLSRWKQGTEGLERAVPRWGDGALDRLRLPHPVLGKLTVREMLFWYHYHNHHHLCRVRERAAAS